MTKARINRVAYVGWRGIHGCEVLDLDDGPLTGLVGPSGAGKTTLVMCLDYALLPDRKVLNIKPISDIQDAQRSGIDALSSRIDPGYGYAYTVLDIHTRKEDRLIAGIFIESADGSADFKRWIIRNAPPEMRLHDILSIADGDREYYPGFSELNQNLASRGIDLITCRSVGEYGQALYEAGILPSNMSIASDRILYANLIETTFKGGISHEVATKLKEYLLPEARQIPEIVRGLEECTNELIKTRSAVRDANKELDLLKATYGVGKELTLYSIRWILDDIHQLDEFVTQQASEHRNACLELQTVSEAIPEITIQIQSTEDLKKNSVQNAGHAFEVATENELRLNQQLPRLDANLQATIANKSLYEKCGKLWRDVAVPNGLIDFDHAISWIDESQKASLTNIVSIDLMLKKLQDDLDRLARGKSSQASETLADQTGGISLEQALKDVDETDALAIEVGLSGLVDGVVGIELEELYKLPASRDLPEIFWCGKKAPTPTDLHEVGDWVLSTTHTGYIVANKNHRSTFGSEARERQRNAIQAELVELSKARAAEQIKQDSWRSLGITFRQNTEGIVYFLQHKNDSIFLDNAVADARSELEACRQKLSDAKTIRETSQRALLDIQLPFDQEISKLRVDLNGRISRKSILDRDVQDYAAKLSTARQRLESTQAELTSTKSVLGFDFDLMQKEAQEIEGFSTTNLISFQAKRLAKLNEALVNESPSRLAKLQDVNAEDRVSMVQIWPVLLEIVRDFVHTDLADTNSVDLIKAMQERRANLDGELLKQENEVKIKARNIASAIRANVQSQKKKIEKLSEFGQHIQFGNVIGIRLALSPRTDMLATLEEFAQQTSLFSDQRAVDEVLRDFFRASLTRKIEMTGEALLDYRNYVDLSIEAMRKGGKWEPAASLSGGEAIGCGLAIALMLIRSIASRGEVKIDQIVPLFAVDEVQRLHPAGQTLLVDFAKREGFQILVTATTMEPSFKCTLYALSRVYDPAERLIVRGVKVRKDAERNPRVDK